MKAKEAIEFVNLYSGWDLNTRYKRKGVIALLKRGEKFERMWRELDEEYGHIDLMPLGVSKPLSQWMVNFEQKHFPE